MNNGVVLDITKVQWASFYWKNQWGDNREKNPKTVTVHNSPVGEHENALVYDGTKMVIVNAIALANEYKIKDVWTPYCKFQLSSNHTITYSGEKALSLWKAWQTKIFKPKK